MGTVPHLDEKNIWRMINTVLLVCIGLSCGKDLLRISVIDLRTILMVFVMILILTLADRVRMRGRLLVLAGICAVLFGVGVVTGLKECLWFFRSYFDWMFGITEWEAAWVAGYEMIQTVILVLLSYLLMLIMDKNFRIKMAGTAALVAGMLYALFAEKEISKPGVAFVICYIVLTYVEWTQMHWKKERSRSIQAYMVWVMPFAVLYFVLIMFCAIPDEPYEWQFVKNVYQHLTESFKKVSQSIIRRGSEDYDLSLSGFSDRGEIGSDMLKNDREIMRIWDADGVGTSVYLSGTVYDTFDGRQWRQLSEDTSKERYLDTVETLYAVKRYDDKYFTDYMNYADFKIDYQYFRSEYLFAPLKAFNILYDRASLDFHEVGGSLFFDKSKGYGTEYEVFFYQMNVGQDAFDRFLNEAGDQRADEAALTRILTDLKTRTGVSVSIDDMAEHRQEVFDHYTGNVTVSDEVKQYIEEITAGAQTDAEKLRAIEAELSDYHYTLTPGELPGTITDESEFLDYFLLESKSGYCTHFATAFTLLARAEGFPARYVQGFCIPLKKNGETIVYSDMAHAWPEVYLDGIGWIPYEPTPGYADIRYTPWAIHRVNENSAGGGNVLPEDMDVPETVGEELSYNGKITDVTGYAVENSIAQFIEIMIIAILFAVGSGIVICVLNWLIADVRYKKMSADEKLKVQVRRNMQILSLMGIRRQEETLEEFRKRVESTALDKDSLRFLENYEGILYGNREADKEAIDMTTKQQEELLLLLKKKKRWAYIYCRFWTRSR